MMMNNKYIIIRYQSREKEKKNMNKIEINCVIICKKICNYLCKLCYYLYRLCNYCVDFVFNCINVRFVVDKMICFG